MQKDKPCKAESCTNMSFCKDMCKKHYQQFLKHGKTFKYTQKDFNEIVEHKTYIELILTNEKLEEVGRAKLDKEDLPLVQSLGRWTLTDQGYVINRRGKVFYFYAPFSYASRK